MNQGFDLTYFADHPLWFAITLGGYVLLWSVLQVLGYWSPEVPVDAYGEADAIVNLTLVEPWDKAILWWWMPLIGPLFTCLIPFTLWAVVCYFVAPLRPISSGLVVWTIMLVAPLLVYVIGPFVLHIKHRMWSRHSRFVAGWCAFSVFVAIEGSGVLNAVNTHVVFPVLSVLPMLFFAAFGLAVVLIPTWKIVSAVLGHRKRSAEHARVKQQVEQLRKIDPSGEILSDAMRANSAGD